MRENGDDQLLTNCGLIKCSNDLYDKPSCKSFKTKLNTVLRSTSLLVTGAIKLSNWNAFSNNLIKKPIETEDCIVNQFLL